MERAGGLASAGAPAGGVPFAQQLRRHGNRVALIGPDQSVLTHAQLADRVAETAARLGAVRRLVLICTDGPAAAGDPAPLITYLAALAAGHPVLLAGPDPAQAAALVAAYDPDVVAGRDGDDGGWLLAERREGTRHHLHPELALLLSTSGSTGSAKLVRLSAAAVQANAEAIGAYLDIRDSDRATLSLPIHYCYGLSVVNSNLARGAGLVLMPGPVTEPRFWELFRAAGATSLHGVPHTFDLLRRVGFADMRLPTLRYVTQAGGALAPARVRELAALGERRGWRFFVMYGQTEATARMAYLPPELAASRPGAIGRPIPGGSFEIIPDPDRPPGEGLLVYRGPNVMLGYAERPADLALGRTVDALVTGDIARQGPDGLYEVVGRAARFIKPFGLRIDLDRVERMLADDGVTAACVGNDELLAVAAAWPDVDRAGALLRSRLRLPATHLRVVGVDELPRKVNGKLDYPAIQALVAAAPVAAPGGALASAATGAAAIAAVTADATAGPAVLVDSARRTAGGADAAVGVGADGIRAQFARVLGRPRVADDATFISLGGDSLTYVQLSLAVERAVGRIPPDWPTTPVAELERLAAARAGRRRPAGALRGLGWPRAVEIDIVLRAAAIVLIVANHVGAFHVLGGAHLLLIVAGWSFARFCLAPAEDAAGALSRRILGVAARIAVPSALWLAWRAAITPDVTWANVLLVNNYLRQGVPGYWFVELLVQLLVVLAALFAVPGARRWERRHRVAAPAVLLGVALLVSAVLADRAEPVPTAYYATHGSAWLFVLGWLACQLPGTRARLALLACAAALVSGYFGNPTREGVVVGGLALLLFARRVALPAPAVALAGVLGGASLYIYLTHYAVYEWALPALGPWPALLLCLAVGVVASHAAGLARRLPTPRELAAGVARAADALRRAAAPRTPVLSGPILLGLPLSHAYGRLNRPG
ncbi:MAG: AMP-binding protein [Frankia sp.]|nr:AMP-binding protein [Frankia sp.]